MRYEFRGKDIKTGEWVYGYLSYSEQQDRYYIGVTELLTPVDPETVGQFTGLLDKESNKVFEGDIVEDDNSYLGKVLFDDKSAGFIVYLPEECDDANLAYLGGEMMPSNEMYKILSNIHDNPELLQ